MVLWFEAALLRFEWSFFFPSFFEFFACGHVMILAACGEHETPGGEGAAASLE